MVWETKVGVGEEILPLTEATLGNRPSRRPDFEAESAALGRLASELADRPETILTALCETVVKCTKAGSAGISLQSHDDAGTPTFVWPSVAGAWASFVGGTMPRYASPCGAVIETGASLLFPGNHEFFDKFVGLEWPIVEVLLAPFFSGGKPAGTVWAICHSPDAVFEREDQRLLKSLAQFAAAAYRTVRTNETLAALNETLEEQVTSRTNSLINAEEALRQSQKMEAIGQLTGGIAHDFNNLLTGIIGSIDIVHRRIKADRMTDVPRFLNSASTAAHRAAGLTNRLLAFARRQSLDAKSIDTNELVASMEDLLRRTLGEGVGLQVRLADTLWPAMLDANQLENAVLNLAINARDAMPNGGFLTIETGNAVLDEDYARKNAEVNAGDYVAISVSDTGTGMPADVVVQAFEPFFTTKPTGSGTGLGLSMIYGFIKQSRGHVRIYSEVGRGTTVRLYLPRALSEARELTEPDSGPTPRGQGETIMVVEDDATVRLLITSVLEELGYKYLQAPDAAAALAMLQTRVAIDLLITDVGLPIMNGRQLAEIARQSQPKLKVLFVTGYAETAAVRGGFLDAGMDMLTKPFALDDLGSKIRSMIERAEVAA
jgi:signal transduction histidine kinase/ActR/RegA family two-component response regulator